MKTIAITGITGHLGGVIALELYARGYAIKALVRGDIPRHLEHLPVHWVRGDLDHQSALDQLVHSCDALIHCAALISINGGQQGAVHRANVEGTRHIMEAAKRAALQRIIYVSSIHAYEQIPVHEGLNEENARPSQSRFAYDRSKRDAQAIALSYASSGIDVLVVNPTSVMGPYDYKPSKLGQAILQMARGKLPFLFQGGFDFCDVRDLATAIVNGLEQGRSGQTYLLSGKWHTLSAVAMAVSEVSGKKIQPMVLPTPLGWLGLPFVQGLALVTGEEPLYTYEALVAVRDGNRHISHAKAAAELGYVPRTLQETVSDTYEWFVKNGYLAQPPSLK